MQDTLETEAPVVPAPENMKFRYVERDGWISLSWASLVQNHPGLQERLESFDQTYDSWKDSVSDAWMSGIHEYARSDAVVHAIRMPDSVDEQALLEFRRQFTASGILYQFEIPRALFVLDQTTLDYVMRYLVITQPQAIVRELLEASATLSEYLPMVGQLDEIVMHMSQHMSLMHGVFGSKKAPNIVVIRTRMGYPMDLSKDMTPDQLRKVLTSMFLRAELPVPSDLLYIDLEVADYVLQRGEFDPTMRWKR